MLAQKWVRQDTSYKGRCNQSVRGCKDDVKRLILELGGSTKHKTYEGVVK